MEAPFKRVICVVLDGVGVGALPDAEAYEDLGSDTLGNLSRAFKEKMGRPLNLPTLQRQGLGSLTSIENCPPQEEGEVGFGFGKAMEKSKGKDSCSGHWEICGLEVEKPFLTFWEGFPESSVQKWIEENKLTGVLWNRPASGTAIIEKLGEEHLQSGKPILYTSADSVWQVAAHEEKFGLDRLYEVCESARKICDDLGVARVIARPFVGNPKEGQPFQRTFHRKDYTVPPHKKTALDYLKEEGVKTIGVGKIGDLFSNQGLVENHKSKGNGDGIKILANLLSTQKEGLILCNLNDFDTLYGHRRDVEGFGKAMEEFDENLPSLYAKLSESDLFLITADHGNDPTHPGTDHTREYIPILAHSPKIKKRINLGIRKSFGDIGATLLEGLIGQPIGNELSGQSFVRELLPL